MKLSISDLAQQIQHMPEGEKFVLDMAAIFGWVTALFGVLTGIVGFIAGVLSMAWCAIRVYETKTVQEWLKKRRARKAR